MKIDTIKKYNNYLLAVLGTFGCILLLLSIIFMVGEMFPRNYYPSENTRGLLTDEKVDLLNQENLRKQIISYETPLLIDTLNTIYMIPVSIKTLKKPEETIYEHDEGLFALMDVHSSGFGKRRGYYSYKNVAGTFANLIIYNPQNEKITSLFKERLIIGNINTYYFYDDIILVFNTATKDTNQDGIIDLEDLQSLCIYSVNTDSLRRISDDDNEIYRYMFIEGTKDMLVQFRLGQYSVKQFDNGESPHKIMKYDYLEDSLVDFIPKYLQEEIQKLVERRDTISNE